MFDQVAFRCGSEFPTNTCCTTNAQSIERITCCRSHSSSMTHMQRTFLLTASRTVTKVLQSVQQCASPSSLIVSIDIQLYLAAVESLRLECLQRELLCQTVQNRRLDLLTISEAPAQSSDASPSTKPVIFITARIHPGETPSQVRSLAGCCTRRLNCKPHSTSAMD